MPFTVTLRDIVIFRCVLVPSWLATLFFHVRGEYSPLQLVLDFIFGFVYPYRATISGSKIKSFFLNWPLLRSI
jgi:hypothetical protein